jgi:tetratricopeptide (TPR) repeat protein
MKPRVFTVMPFGNKQVRAAVPATPDKPAQAALFVDYSEVYRRLIGPAIAAAGCEPFRADQESGSGDIRTDMFFELVTADFVVADISILNPNVFYELGVRHTATPGGVVHLHGGWEKQPFDVAPDRLFSYDGTLWETSVPRDASWDERLAREIAALTQSLREAIRQDQKTTGSPVYSHLVGLKPVDWREISIARARYFQGVLNDWQERLRVAQKKGWPGDILTLAEDAPTRYHNEKLLFAAAKSLIDLCRFDIARAVLEELLALKPDHLDAQCQLGLTLNRLGEIDQAEVRLQEVVNDHKGEPEAQGILGRVYKDRWRVRWEGKTDLKERQNAATISANFAVLAAQSYAAAQRSHLGDYYNGINVISLTKLLEYLGQATGRHAIGIGLHDVEDLTSVVRVAATADLDRARNRMDDEGLEAAVWANATLGELAVLLGDVETALHHYRVALTSPRSTHFKVNSMLSQIEILASLGFRPEVVTPVRELLKAAAEMPQRGHRRVFLASGHMTDRPGREHPRFPQERETIGRVRDAIAAQLDRWQAGPDDLALCGGARGADLLFAEICLQRGAHVRLLLPLLEGDFLRESVRLPGTDWEDRYFAVKAKAEVWYQLHRLGPPPEGESAFARNNLWILNTARIEAPPPPEPPFSAVLVWDGKQGDGPGGTSHFAQQIDRLGGRRAVVDPMGA